MPWKEVKEVKGSGILGHWESEEGSMITITKGIAHIVHKGRAIAAFTPEEMYSDNPATIAKMIAKKLNPTDTVK
jgi:hypothetical protein